MKRSEAFQARQMRSLFSKHQQVRAIYKERLGKLAVKSKEVHGKRSRLQAEVDELARRKAFLEGRREQLLSEERERKERFESLNIFADEEEGQLDFPSFFNRLVPSFLHEGKKGSFYSLR